MKAGCLTSFYLAAALLVIVVLLGGCSAALPSMRYCDKVEYKRDGNKVKVEAECYAKAGGMFGGL